MKTSTTVKACLARMFRDWKTLFRTRADAIDHLFFVIGNGYEWRKGALVRKLDEMDAMPDPFANHPNETIREVYAKLRAEEDAMPVGPLPDDGKLRHFYPVCGYSKINTVPANVRPDWLALAREAAIMLSERSDTAENREAGQRAVRKLRRLRASATP